MAGVENSVGRRAWAALVTACGGKAQPALDGVATRPNSIASYIQGVVEKKEDEDVKDLAIIQDDLGVYGVRTAKKGSSRSDSVAVRFVEHWLWRNLGPGPNILAHWASLVP
jgi:hypothetical protein